MTAMRSRLNKNGDHDGERIWFRSGLLKWGRSNRTRGNTTTDHRRGERKGTGRESMIISYISCKQS